MGEARPGGVRQFASVDFNFVLCSTHAVPTSPDRSANQVEMPVSQSQGCMDGEQESPLDVAIRRVERQRSATAEEIRGHTDTPHQDYGHSNSWI